MSIDQVLSQPMQSTIIGKVISATRYAIDEESKGGSVWVTKPTTGKNKNVLGEDIIKIGMPYEMFSQLQQRAESGEYEFPGLYEILCDVDMGGGNRAKLSAVSIRKYIDPDAKLTTQNQPNPTENKPTESGNPLDKNPAATSKK